jgi:hypothetical protein
MTLIDFCSQTVFSLLTSSNTLKPSNHITFNDLSIGIPNLLLTIEMAIISIAFLYIYRTQEYIYKPTAVSAVPLGHGGYQGGFMGFRAYAQAINTIDILQCIVSLPALLLKKQPRYIDGSGGRRRGERRSTRARDTEPQVSDMR